MEDGAFVLFCGVYGGKEIIKILRTVRGLWNKSFFQHFVSLDNCLCFFFGN